jgi:hypothetical protein
MATWRKDMLMNTVMKSFGTFALSALLAASMVSASDAQATDRRYSALFCQMFANPPSQGENVPSGVPPAFVMEGNSGVGLDPFAALVQNNTVLCPIDSDAYLSFQNTVKVVAENGTVPPLSPAKLQACITFAGSIGGACGANPAPSPVTDSNSLSVWNANTGFDYAYLAITTVGGSGQLQGYGFDTNQPDQALPQRPPGH